MIMFHQINTNNYFWRHTWRTRITAPAAATGGLACEEYAAKIPCGIIGRRSTMTIQINGKYSD